eukprot:TRINITY_DN2325_c0_g1_i1.p1 TRINITY_DN2325_c0_g1~~TRINITY_DN2325_c0_g1_i1.p1  ORF type:complete len:130 (+),score=15.35 TRINITY_DN2325_c0_g1_i1:105-494(+)
MFLQFIFSVLIIETCYGARQNSPDLERDIPEMSVPQLIEYWGYPVEEHWVTTTDGYILGLHRIPHGRNNNDEDTKSPRPVVYMQHCLTCSSGIWTFGLNQSLGYIWQMLVMMSGWATVVATHTQGSYNA